MSLPRFHEDSYGHFVTTKTFQSQRLFTDPKNCQMVLDNLEFYRQQLHFDVLGYCLMPDHFHMIVWWDVDAHPKLTIGKIMQGIKSHSAKEIVTYHQLGRRGPLTSPGGKRPGQGTRATHPGVYPKRRMSVQTTRIWQPSFYDFNIHSDNKLRQKLAYIHNNPVTAGLCKNPEDWPWSSYRQVELGEQSKEVAITTW
ncbi:MAG: transposase [Patescibacteria group bacterium]|jgi:REP element-mobilizing transposase RayT